MTRLPDFAAFEPADALEAGYREALVELAGHPRPTSRDTFAPGHYTASAFVLSPDGRDLLLIEHAKLARWLQPGGHVDPDDADLVAAARREGAEETGLHDLELLQPAPFDLDVHVIPARKADPEHRHFDVRYLFRALTRHYDHFDMAEEFLTTLASNVIRARVALDRHGNREEASA